MSAERSCRSCWPSAARHCAIMTIVVRALVLSAFVGSFAIGSARLSWQQPPAVPVNPIDAVLDAVRTHRIVALGEGVNHGHETAYQFRLALIRDPRFTETVTDVVVEIGNARYQDTIDRFERGEHVPEEA